MSENTNAQDVIIAAMASAEPAPVEPGGLYSVIVPPGGHHQLLDLDLDKYLERPRRKQGTTQLHDADSFAQYVTKHELPQTEVYADETNCRVVAVINADMGNTGDGVEDYAGWGDHRAQFDVKPTKSWQAWVAHDNQYMSQTDFAEHIENRSVDIVKPTGADMLELAQSISGTVGVTFESSKQISSGQRQLVYKEEVSASAGQRGRLDIPSVIELALVPWQGAPAYKVTARFRFRINNGHLLLSYSLERPEDVLHAAFADVVSVIAGDIGRPVLMGWPKS